MPSAPAGNLWFDAHLDLAYLAVCGRDMTVPLRPESGPHPPAAVTLPALAAGGVRMALATIFTERIDPAPPASQPATKEPQMYPADDAARAFAVGRAQLEVYLTWQDKELVSLNLARSLRRDPEVGRTRGGMGVAVLEPYSITERVRAALRDKNGAPWLHIAILMENADPIRSPDELVWWVERGVRAIGLAWARPSRYAGGNGSQTGLTDLGRELVKEMDRLGVLHDVSHLSDRSLADLLELTPRPVMASHSNCRALLGGGGFGENQRHLTDDAIREIARRGGVIGLNLYSAFLHPKAKENGRASIADCVQHVEHVCETAGHRRAVALGSDMDGGFSAARLPEGIDTPADLAKLGAALRNRGWSDDDIAGFAWRNMAEFVAGDREQSVR